jgi:adenine-specific DNA-methyltransferase
MSQKYEKLKTLLKELFQLDQPDLDFGFYRVMHARAAEVTQFLDKDLLPQVKAAFTQYQPADKAAIEKELAKVIAGIEAAGMNPEESPKVRELRERLANDAVDLDVLEAEVYDHLFSFFRRYYSEGDFLSKRVYKPGVYAIPYEGEEVKLHWANADQYYIKTSEYLRDYAFRLRPDDEKNPMRVHFRLADAAEGEHGNVKEQAGKERRFKLAAENFAAVEDGELVIRFTYEPDPARQKELNAAAETAILGLADAALAGWVKALSANHVRADGTAAEATRLRVHLDRYTARNTFDYFIHKDLGGFLRRELDFYIKNEVMHLDDVENESAPRVEQYLSKIKVIRKIAGKIIAFLAQLEDFQKKLWLKKKFVVETSWCIRLGVIPEEFYPEIAANDTQREEWVRLCAIDELKATAGSLLEPGTPGYSVPLTPECLKTHPTLMVDTRYFDAAFTARLLEAMSDVDEQTDGVLPHSENSQALSVMQTRYREQVNCVYIDPPYNTGNDGFAYKDNYQHSSWTAMFEARAELARSLLGESGVFFFSIDETEAPGSWLTMKQVFGDSNFATEIIWEKKKKPSFLHRNIGKLTDFVFAFNRHSPSSPPFSVEATTEGKLTPLNNAGNPLAILRFPAGSVHFGCADGLYRAQDMSGGNIITRLLDDVVVVDGVNQGEFRLEGEWRYSQEKLDEVGSSGDELYISKVPFRPNHVKGGGGIKKMKNVLSPTHYAMETNEDASEQVKNLFGVEAFKNPKPEKLIRYLARSVTHSKSGSIALDYFAGSGTTGHAVINLNREDGGHRKFILVEQGDYFDTVLLPRLKKVTFTPEWKDGKPKRLATPEESERSPRIMKVVRLESYEDTLNNLELRRTKEQQGLLDLASAQGADKFKEQYMLRYLLDVETRGSQSLLNVGAFTDPTAYKLKVKRPGSDESREVNVDLLETFNWLIGLTVQHLAAPQTFSAEAERDGEGRLRLKGRLRSVQSSVASVQETKAGAPSLKTEPLKTEPLNTEPLKTENDYWFRTVTGTTPDGRKTLVIWRKRPGGESAEGIERDNLVLDEWFTKQGYSSKDSEFDLIYVNGDNNLENLKAPDDTWKVRLIEEDFFRLMFETEGV